MALLQCDFCSAVLGYNTALTVLLPEKRHAPRKREDRKYPVLYALHGHGQDHTSWMRDSIIEYLLKDLDVIVVMPNCGRSFYTDGKAGYEYFSFLTGELPIIVANYFPASVRREDTFIAGLSMGGYGALKAAFQRPDLYAGVGVLSAAIDPYQTMKSAPEGMFSCRDLLSNIDAVFGSEADFYASPDFLSRALKNLKKSGEPFPKIYQACGTEDFLYGMNGEFKALLEKEGVEFTYEEAPGMHNWEFWNNMLPNLLKTIGVISP